MFNCKNVSRLRKMLSASYCDQTSYIASQDLIQRLIISSDIMNGIKHALNKCDHIKQLAAYAYCKHDEGLISS